MTNPTCDFDCWTATKKDRQWLADKSATLLSTAYGFAFYENPITGDETPVLAVQLGMGNSPVWNTQDFDLPTHDPKEAW